MRTPPFLLGATLLFWGWQTGFLIVGTIMAVVLEGSRFVQLRWDFSDDDFSRIWTLCSVLLLTALAYAFTSNEGPSSIRDLFSNPDFAAQRAAGITSSRVAASFIRWLPMVFFLFVSAQCFSSRDEVPIATVSLILRRRWKKAVKAGQPPPPSKGFNASYPYFAICLTAASIHGGEHTEFFWGLCALLTWALWSHRSRRFSFGVWALALSAAVALGYFGQFGIGRLQQWIVNYNPQWFSHFARRGFDPTHSRTAIGQIGRLKLSGQIVIRLEPKNGSRAPQYLREASYQVFRSPVWSAGNPKDNFENVAHGTNETTWPLLPQKSCSATNTIACYLDGQKDSSPAGLLPLPGGSARLENLPAYILSKNDGGAVLAEGPGLVIFDACSGPGQTIDAPPGSNDLTEVPEVEVNALNRVIADLKLQSTNTDDVLPAIQRYFQTHFTYSTWQKPDRTSRTNSTPLTRFLLQTHSGHCEYFATATVLLLRQLGIPARYAIGYAVHEASGSGYVVRERDAHAWCLVWRNGTWQNFDTTPASWVEQEGKRASLFQFLSDWWSYVKFQIARFRWGQTNLRQYLPVALVPVLAILLYQIIFRKSWRQHQKRKSQVAIMNWPGLDSEFYQLEKKLAQRGLPRQSSEPLSDWLERAARDPVLADLRGALRALLRLHYRLRFDPLGLNETDREALRRETRSCLASLAKPAA